MDTVSSLPSALPFGINFRSMGMKLIVVCALALFMTIPALFVGGLVEERTMRAADVVQEISGHVGGQQTFLGPTRLSCFRPMQDGYSPADCTG